MRNTMNSFMKSKGKKGADPQREEKITPGQHQAAATSSTSRTNRRPVLYPVKKMMIHHEQRADPYSQATGELPEPSTTMDCVDYFQSIGRTHPTYSSTPLTLTRPSGVEFNIQAPDGGRARFPLLSDRSRNLPSTSYTSSLSNPTPHTFLSSRQVITSTLDRNYQASCSNPLCLDHSKCHILQPNVPSTNTNEISVPRELSAWPPLATTAAETLWLPSSHESAVSQYALKNDGYAEQFHYRSFGDEKIKGVFPSPPLSGEQSPAAPFSNNAGFLAPSSQPHYPANITPPVDSCSVQDTSANGEIVSLIENLPKCLKNYGPTQ